MSVKKIMVRLSSPLIPSRSTGSRCLERCRAASRHRAGENSRVEGLLSEYRRQKTSIKRHLGGFEKSRQRPDEDLFEELCFCILTPQSKATKCDEAIADLKKKGLLLNGRPANISKALKGRVRFHNKKAEYIVAARNLFKGNDKFGVRHKIKDKDSFVLRDWLVKNVKGFGYKEASHFLRNIGKGRDIAILDRHILKNLKRYNVIAKIPSSLSSRSAYLLIEEKARRFCKKINIPPGELDLLLWSSETGFMFK